MAGQMSVYCMQSAYDFWNGYSALCYINLKLGPFSVSQVGHPKKNGGIQKGTHPFWNSCSWNMWFTSFCKSLRVCHWLFISLAGKHLSQCILLLVYSEVHHCIHLHIFFKHANNLAYESIPVTYIVHLQYNKTIPPLTNPTPQSNPSPQKSWKQHTMKGIKSETWPPETAF